MDFVNEHEEISPKDLIELRRALEFGTPTPATGGEGYGWPLVPQSIEATLAVATVQAKHVKFFKALPKPDDFLKSAVHEYTRQVEIGYDLEPFVTEGALPPEHASRYRREFVRVKYMATLRRVTDPMAAVQTIGNLDAVTRESVNGTLHLLVQLEKALFFGDESANPQAFDGVFKAVEKQFPENVFDLRGAELTPDICQEISAAMVKPPRYASPEALWISPAIHVSLAKQVSPNLLYFADPTVAAAYAPGVQVLPRGFTGAHNQFIPYETDIFLDPDPLRDTGPIGTAPKQQFNVTTAVSSPSEGEKSLFGSTDAGRYVYGVAAYGASGRSSVTTITNVNVSAGQKVTITIARTGTNEDDIVYYQIYRSKPGDTTLFPIGKVRYNTSGNTVFTDLNQEIAGTAKAVMLEYDPTVAQFRRLLPLIRIPLAKVDLSVRFAIVMFGMPIFETPTKIAVIKNIGISA